MHFQYCIISLVKLGNACYHSVLNHSDFCLLSSFIKARTYNYCNFTCLYACKTLVSNIKGKI